MDIALFFPSSLFHDEDDSSSSGEENTESQQSHVERTHEFPGMGSILVIAENTDLACSRTIKYSLERRMSRVEDNHLVCRGQLF